MRYWSVFLFLSAAAGSTVSGSPGSEAGAQLERDGQSLFVECELVCGILLRSGFNGGRGDRSVSDRIP
jgi:hypothetical protein